MVVPVVRDIMPVVLTACANSSLASPANSPLAKQKQVCSTLPLSPVPITALHLLPHAMRAVKRRFGPVVLTSRVQPMTHSPPMLQRPRRRLLGSTATSLSPRPMSPFPCHLPIQRRRSPWSSSSNSSEVREEVYERLATARSCICSASPPRRGPHPGSRWQRRPKRRSGVG